METRVVFAEMKLKEAFADLKSTDPRLHKEIVKTLNEIRQNTFVGRQVRKKLIPKDLQRKYRIDNLWICNLRRDWRLLYSVSSDRVEILALVLDWMSHKEYERLFRFT